MLPIHVSNSDIVIIGIVGYALLCFTTLCCGYQYLKRKAYDLQYELDAPLLRRR